MADLEIREFSLRRFSNLMEIGDGAFGTAYRAKLQMGSRKNPHSEIVAVKVLKYGDAVDVWDECNRMVGLDHPNILQLIGISTARDGEIPWIITEYMMGRDLHSYILDYPGLGMTADLMVKFAHGIASGMAYLHHGVNPGEIHGDLAARNCLVGPNNIIKIGDFGKFEDAYDDCYYSDCSDRFLPCPIRWMPPENVPDDFDQSKPVFTRKGDVWAFGVVLFEIWARGRLPYEDLEDSEVLSALACGENPGTYYNVSARGYILDLTEDCWEFDPKNRPNFKQIKKRFEQNDKHLLN